MSYKQSCDGCDVREQCQYSFGRFWRDKSSGGKGCNHPLKPWSDETRRRILHLAPGAAAQTKKNVKMPFQEEMI